MCQALWWVVHDGARGKRGCPRMIAASRSRRPVTSMSRLGEDHPLPVRRVRLAVVENGSLVFSGMMGAFSVGGTGGRGVLSIDTLQGQIEDVAAAAWDSWLSLTVSIIAVDFLRQTLLIVSPS